MRREIDSSSATFWAFEPGEMDAQELRAKMDAFEELAGHKPRVLVRGSWYGPINGREWDELGYSLHTSGRWWPVVKVGRRYVTIRQPGGRLYRVDLVETPHYQESRALARMFDRDPDHCRLSGAEWVRLEVEEG